MSSSSNQKLPTWMPEEYLRPIDMFLSRLTPVPSWSEDVRRYLRQVNGSRGFEASLYKKEFYGISLIAPKELTRSFLTETANPCTSFAMDEYNKKEGTNFKFLEVEKVNNQLCGTDVYYITFKARDDNNGEIKTFQAVVSQNFIIKDDLTLLSCRLKVER